MATVGDNQAPRSLSTATELNTTEAMRIITKSSSSKWRSLADSIAIDGLLGMAMKVFEPPEDDESSSDDATESK